MDYDVLIINADIDHSVIREVFRLKRDEIADRLVIILDTRGGDPFVAYRSMQHLGALYKKIEIIVPDQAMSAGTLMCMGADEIYMFEGSSLGPLDLQVPHPNDGGQISTLDIRQSTYNIFGLTTTVTKQFFDQAILEMKLGKNQAAKIAHESAVELLKPMIEKIDPYHLHASYRAAQIGQKYARILLASRMMKDNLQQASETSKVLAESYQTHSYSITMEEAIVHLELRVKNITELDVLSHVQSFIWDMPPGINYIPVRNTPLKTERSVKDEPKK